MNTRTTTWIIGLTIILTAANLHADGFEDLLSVGDAGRLHEAAGAFVAVHDGQGRSTGERVFLLHGGYPEMLDAEPASDVWILDGGAWQRVSSEAPAMACHTMVTAADGRAWAFGGIGADDWLRSLDEIVVFTVRRVDGALEVSVEQLQVPGPSPESCFGGTAVAIDGGRAVLHVGGDCLGDPLQSAPGQVWEYSIIDNRWRRRADLPVALSDHSAVAARDFVWVFGGSRSDDLSDALYRYDLLTDTWDRVEPAGGGPAARRDHGAVAVGNTMLVFGGIEMPFFPETLDDVWQLDLDTVTWTEKASMPGGLAGMTLALVPSTLQTASTGQVLIYGGVVDAWSFPYDLSDRTLVYTSDTRVARVRYVACATR
jgi:hypothetical protein